MPPGANPSRRWGAPRPGVRLTGGVGPEVGEDLVDHRRLRDDGDDAHRAVAAGTGERVDLENLLKQGRPPAGRLGRGQRSRDLCQTLVEPRCGAKRIVSHRIAP